MPLASGTDPPTSGSACEAPHYTTGHAVPATVVVILKEAAKGKRYPRFIHLLGPALEIVRRLTAVRTEGKLFRNTRGELWTKYALCSRMYRLSPVAGVKKTAYDMRHGFATRKLVQCHDHLTIAELMGHRDDTLLARVYAHLDRNDAHLKKALEE